MRKIFLVLATALTSMTLAFAQDYNEVVETFNKGIEAKENNDLDQALTLFQQAYTMGVDNEECAEMMEVCKVQIPAIACSIATREYNAGNYRACIGKAEAAIALAEQFNDTERLEKARSIASDARFYDIKDLEKTDAEAAKEAYRQLVENGEARAAGSLAKLYRNEAKERWNQATTLKDQEKKDACRQAFDIAKESLLYEEHADAFKVLGNAARILEQWEESIAGYEKYLELKPEAKDAITITNYLAKSYEKAGDKASAIAHYKKVAESDNEKLKAAAAKSIERLSK